jgi:predicted dehydrogenase
VKKLKWGVLGCSSFAFRRAIPALLQAELSDLVAVASRTPDKAESFRSTFGIKRAYGTYDELLSDPEIEAIHITTVNGLHADWMVKALENGKHILCEKPFTVNLSQAERVYALASASKLQVMEAFVWRHHPQHNSAMQAIEQGAIGEVRLVRPAFTFLLKDPSIRCDPVLGGGSVLDAGCYPISSARYYFRAEPTTVNTRGFIHPEYKVDMNVAGMLEFSDGVALIDCGFDSPFRTDLEIVGTKGRIYFPKAWQPPERATIFINEEAVVLPPCNQYVLQVEQFSQCVLNQSPVGHGIEDAYKQMKTIAAVLRSIESGKPEAV